MTTTQITGTYLRSSYQPVAHDTIDEPVPTGDPTELVSEILGYDVRQIENPDQAWFWSRSWQAKEAEADAAIEAGRIASFDNGEDFLSDLDSDD